MRMVSSLSRSSKLSLNVGEALLVNLLHGKPKPTSKLRGKLVQLASS